MDHHQHHHPAAPEPLMEHSNLATSQHHAHGGESHNMAASASGGGLTDGGHMMMMMYFHGGYSEVILFDFWRISTLAGLIGSMIGCFLMGILYEGIKSYREYWMNGAFHAVTYNQVI